MSDEQVGAFRVSMVEHEGETLVLLQAGGPQKIQPSNLELRAYLRPEEAAELGHRLVKVGEALKAPGEPGRLHDWPPPA